MPPKGQLSRSQIIQQIGSQLEGEITFDDFAERVLAIWPSNAKNPKTLLRSEMRYEMLDYGLIYLDNRRHMLTRLEFVMPGVRFRHIVSEREAERGILFLDADFIDFLPHRHFNDPKRAIEELTIKDESGQPMPITLGYVQWAEQSSFGESIRRKDGILLEDWFIKHDIKAGDSIVFTSIDVHRFAGD